MPDLLFADGRFERGSVLACDASGRVVAVHRIENTSADDEDLRRAVAAATGFEVSHVCLVRLRGRALLPGMVNAHSHAFQRVIRGRTEYRSAHSDDSFWTWREMMYAASARLTPEDIYDASRMAFAEMVAGGITSVGEFHYLHRTPRGEEYEDPNLLAKQLVRAARDVGIRIALLRVAYARAGFRKPPDERQRRFIEPDAETFILNTEALIGDLARDEMSDDRPKGGTPSGTPPGNEPMPAAWVGVAPHSVRAVPLGQLREVRDFAAARGLALHMHVAEQPAEVAACVEETRRTPVALLADEGLLSERFTGVHAVHITPGEVASLASSRARVCACPTTERNLGDGVVRADELFDAGVPVALGTDSHAQIDLLEDARELEYHLRLVRQQRNVLAPARADDENGGDGSADVCAEPVASPASALAARLFECATLSGARSIGAHAGELAPGRAADFFTVDLNDASIAGATAEDLLPAIVFSLSRAAVRETAVGGRLVVEEGRLAAQAEIVSRFAALQKKLWS